MDDKWKQRRISSAVLAVITLVLLFGLFRAFNYSSLQHASTFVPLWKENVVKHFKTFEVGTPTNYHPFTKQSLIHSEEKVKTNDGLLSDSLVKVGRNMFYAFTAIARFSKNKKGNLRWTKLYVTGWENKKQSTSRYKCCYIYENGTTIETSSTYKVATKWPETPLWSRQVVCPMNFSGENQRPRFASLVMINGRCEDTQFIRIVYSRPIKTKQFAICGKIAYGKKDPTQIIEWIEYYKYLGVDKIVIYLYYNLNEPARRVMDYYVDQGILETVNMPSAPERDIYPRVLGVPNTTMLWQDQKVPLLDSEQRLRAYSYYAVIDTDEYIVPKLPGVTTLTQLMDNMLLKYPDAGSFLMMAEFHILDWNKTSSSSDLMIGQYGLHTSAIFRSKKLIHVRDRLHEGSLWIHQAKNKNGYRVITPDPSSEVMFKHFRKCYTTWLSENKGVHIDRCLGGFEPVPDTHMEGIAKIIGPEVEQVISALNLRP